MTYLKLKRVTGIIRFRADPLPLKDSGFLGIIVAVPELDLTAFNEFLVSSNSLRVALSSLCNPDT